MNMSSKRRRLPLLHTPLPSVEQTCFLRFLHRITMSKVTLGMPGPWAANFSEPSDHYTSKIGGLPDWPAGIDSLSPTLLEFSSCKNKLSLVAQVYAPISTLKIEERVIYILGCVDPKCGGPAVSWRALRAQKQKVENVEDQISNDHKPTTLSTSSFWDDGDDIDLEELRGKFSQATTVASSSKKQINGKNNSKNGVKNSPITASRSLDKDMPVLPCFYVYAQEEPSSKEITSLSTNYSSLSIGENAGDTNNHSQEEKWEEEGYEYDRALHAARTYLKFKKKTDAYPEQCFRYSYVGRPSLAAQEVLDSGSCKLCGAPRLYKMQLMPPLLYFLLEEVDDCQEQSQENWNWMTLIVYTCSESCSASRNQGKCDGNSWFMVEEGVVLQSETPLNGPADLGKTCITENNANTPVAKTYKSQTGMNLKHNNKPPQIHAGNNNNNNGGSGYVPRQQLYDAKGQQTMNDHGYLPVSRILEENNNELVDNVSDWSQDMDEITPVSQTAAVDGAIDRWLYPPRRTHRLQVFEKNCPSDSYLFAAIGKSRLR